MERGKSCSLARGAGARRPFVERFQMRLGWMVGPRKSRGETASAARQGHLGRFSKPSARNFRPRAAAVVPSADWTGLSEHRERHGHVLPEAFVTHARRPRSGRGSPWAIVQADPSPAITAAFLPRRKDFFRLRQSGAATLGGFNLAQGREATTAPLNFKKVTGECPLAKAG